MPNNQEPEWDSTEIAHWDPVFQRVLMPTSVDGVSQPAMVKQADGNAPRPLLVSLHTWSGGYEQKDAFAKIALDQNWHYIHPHFRGRNRHPDACLSSLALSDIDDAIDWALANWNVDAGRIIVRGASGGGMATCAVFMNTRHAIKEYHAWVPLTDVERWYYESRARESNYANDILACVGQDSNGNLNAEEARKRSPLYMKIPERPSAKLNLYAGIHDGYKGSVPISHSILLFNRLATHFGSPESCVPLETAMDLLSRGARIDPSIPPLLGRGCYIRRESPWATLTIFEGAHEGLVG